MADWRTNRSPEALERRKEYQRRYRRGRKPNYSPEALAKRKEYARIHIEHLRNTEPRYSLFARRLRRHNFSQQGFDDLLALQGGICPVCKRPLIPTASYTGETPTLDHDHTCCPKSHSCGKCIQGILHARCNNALGCVNDDPDMLRNAADYLEQCIVRKLSVR